MSRKKNLNMHGRETGWGSVLKGVEVCFEQFPDLIAAEVGEPGVSVCEQGKEQRAMSGRGYASSGVGFGGSLGRQL